MRIAQCPPYPIITKIEENDVTFLVATLLGTSNFHIQHSSSPLSYDDLYHYTKIFNFLGYYKPLEFTHVFITATMIKQKKTRKTLKCLN